MYVIRNDRPPRARIAAVGSYLPAREVSSAEIEHRLRHRGVDIPVGFIERATGIQSRRVAGEHENASDLAVEAAREALAAAGTDAREVELLIFAAASHDVTEPATANIVQAKLEARNAVVFDLKNACNSFVCALDVADTYVRSRRVETVLIATGEVPSLVTSLDFASRDELMQNFAHLTMGDAGTAAVVRHTEEDGAGILATAWLNQGEQWDLATVLANGTMHWGDRSPARALLHSRGVELEAWARREMPVVIQAALQAVGWAAADVDVVACHQHTRRIVTEILHGFDRPGHVPLPLVHAGNAASANVGLALAEAARSGNLRPGARTLLCSGSAGCSAIATALRW